MNPNTCAACLAVHSREINNIAKCKHRFEAIRHGICARICYILLCTRCCWWWYVINLPSDIVIYNDLIVRNVIWEGTVCLALGVWDWQREAMRITLILWDRDKSPIVFWSSMGLEPNPFSLRVRHIH